MTENFTDTSGILGFRPNEADNAEATQAEADQQETGNELESEGVDLDQVNADASNEDEESGNDEASGDEGGQDDTAALQAKLKKAEDDLAAKEQSRRDWQSKANSSDADLGKALDLLHGRDGSKPQETAKQAPGSKALDRISDLDAQDVVDAGTLRNVIEDFRAEQVDQQNARAVESQQTELDNFTQRIDREVLAQPDYKEVVEYFNSNNLMQTEGAELNNGLGRYYFTKAMMAEDKIKKAFEDGKVEGAKSAKSRKKKLDDIPPMSGGIGARETPSGDPSGIVGSILARRKQRGIRADGSFR